MRRLPRAWSILAVTLVIGVVVFILTTQQNDESQPQATNGSVASQPSDLSLQRGAERSTNAANVVTGDEAAYLSWKERVVETLIRRNDADSLTAAALMLYSLRNPPDKRSLPQIIDLLSRASSLTPRDASIRSLLIAFCNVQSECDSAPHEDALRDLEPNNAVGWLVTVLRADKNKNNTMLRGSFGAMAQCDSFDFHWVENIHRLERAVDSVRAPPPDSIAAPNYSRLRDEIVSAGMHTMPFPEFLPLLNLCNSTTDPSMQAQCLGAGTAMAKGDMILAQMAGLTIAANSVPSSSIEAQRIAEAQRQLHWLTQGPVKNWQLEPSDLSRSPPELTREEQLLRRRLTELGSPSQPPAGWRK